ncbi:MAG: hypothetical protein PF508_07355 [Spirochaeta sp.]|jgi:hypothetical protein|nr:hypothetical protein [Spirochaeta sp.]
MRRVIAVLLILAAGSVAAQSELQPGTVVFGEWFENQWYHGTIQGPCSSGYTILAETGETKCVPSNKIVLDVVPDAGEVKEGSPVLAEWAPGQFYPGVVSSVGGGSYDIQYDDGDRSTVRLSGIRLQGNLDAQGATIVETTKEPTLENAITVLREGNVWAEIQPDGTVLVQGSPVGEIAAGGAVHRGGRLAGTVDSDGVISQDGSRVGEIEMNGRLWRGSSPIGAVLVNGDVYLGNSKWAEADVSSLGVREQRILAALAVFFAPDFGFIR